MKCISFPSPLWTHMKDLQMQAYSQRACIILDCSLFSFQWWWHIKSVAIKCTWFFSSMVSTTCNLSGMSYDHFLLIHYHTETHAAAWIQSQSRLRLRGSATQLYSEADMSRQSEEQNRNMASRNLTCSPSRQYRKTHKQRDEHKLRKTCELEASPPGSSAGPQLVLSESTSATHRVRMQPFHRP